MDMSPGLLTSRYRRATGDGLLIKLNTSALRVFLDDRKPLPSWLELAKRSLKRAGNAMNATASDLKEAYIYYTRAAAILGEIIPHHHDFAEFESDAQYIPIKQTILPAIEVEVEKLWTLLSHRERPRSDDPLPFLKAQVHVRKKSITFLLPVELTYSILIEEIANAFSRHCLSAKYISIDSPIQLSGPVNFQALLFGDNELDEALDGLGEALELEKVILASRAAEILQTPEELPSYSLFNHDDVPETPGTSTESLRNFSLEMIYDDLFKDGGVIDLQIGLW